MAMKEEIVSLAFKGEWTKLLPLLSEHPHLVNVASEPKGYTPLHQAAWHGAKLSVIGELLQLGADRSNRTLNKQQTPWDIAKEKHRDREDLDYALQARRATIAQLFRKVISSNRDLFGDLRRKSSVGRSPG